VERIPRDSERDSSVHRAPGVGVPLHRPGCRRDDSVGTRMSRGASQSSCRPTLVRPGGRPAVQGQPDPPRLT
jgi:hypothetical protein